MTQEPEKPLQVKFNPLMGKLRLNEMNLLKVICQWSWDSSPGLPFPITSPMAPAHLLAAPARNLSGTLSLQIPR
jgi:hypothetical protein